MTKLLTVIPLFSAIGVLLAASLSGCGSKNTASSGKTDEKAAREEIFYADPTVYYEDGKYYMTGTAGRQTGVPGFSMLVSSDLREWKYARPDTMILRAGNSTFGSKGFWAPQILKVGNRYRLTYTANEQTVLAEADSLTGPYVQKEIAPIDGSEKNIDSFLFTDDDGTSYLYHVRFDHGNFIWCGRFDPVTGRIAEGTLTRCFANDQPWEATADYESDPIMEGPTVIKLDGKYYLFYSANHFMSRDYAVGYAVADSPRGPWRKNPHNPIIHRDIVGENGSGHGDIFADNEGNLRYVYHIHNSDSVVSPRRTRILTLNLQKDTVSGEYDITADPASIIRPVITD